MSGPAQRRRVLLVTSSYAPTVIADMHRVRLLAWELPALGWDVEILVPGREFQRAEYFEPDSACLFAPGIPVHEVKPAGDWLFRLLSMRSIGWRALAPLRAAGNRLLREGRFDLVFISSGNFNLFCLGRGWSRRYGVPCVLDFHDPWVRDSIDFSTTGNRFKRRIAAWLSRWMERYAVRGASGMVAVSPVYLEELRARHGTARALAPGRSAAIPFGASGRDFSAFPVDSSPPPASERHIAYVGAGGSIMARSFSTLCDALAQVRRSDPDLFGGLRIHLSGTYAYWRPGEPRPLAELAARYGLADVVSEEPARISYAEATRRASRADGLLVLGVDDAGYVPSKLFGYALAGKPLLASFRSDSPMVDLFRRLPGLGHAVIYDAASGAPVGDVVSSVRQFLREVCERRSFDRGDLTAEFMAPAMARRHAELFARVLAGKGLN